MPAVTTLFEHEAATFPWTDRDLPVLARLSDRMGTDVLKATVFGTDHALRAGSYVGVVRLGDRVIQILPKIHRPDPGLGESVRVREATRNLLFLLEQAGVVRIREHDLAGLLEQCADWFEILTRLFALHLLEEWQRAPVRHYQAVEDDLPVLRGKWRVRDQLRRPERMHLFAVTFDEFTTDNPLNRVLRFVVERLWRLTRDMENRIYLGELREWMDEVALLPSITAADANPSLVTRLHQQYEPLLNLARLFLDGGVLQLGAGETTTYAFVFDMNRLFEAFVIRLIQTHRQELLAGSPLERAELLVHSGDDIRYLAVRESDDLGVFPLQPDVVFRTGKTIPLLLDAKYKMLDPHSRQLGVSPDDLYQMIAYGYRYTCSRVVLVYPQTAQMATELRERFRVEGGGTTICAATIDLTVNLAQESHQRALMTRIRELLVTC